jgi:transcriptional regulator with XRE-family HTH domain
VSLTYINDDSNTFIIKSGNNMTNIHRKIKEARHRAGITQGDMAKLCGLTRNAVTLWESGREEARTSPQIPEIMIICKATGAPLEWLLSDEADVTEGWGRSEYSSLSSDEREIVSAYRSVSNEKKSVISAFLQFTCMPK